MRPWPSGSEAVAARVTTSPSLTVWLEPASTAGASLSALTVTVTVSTVVFVPSLTEHCSTTELFVRPSGAVNDGVAVDAPLSVTAGPETCVHV